MSIPAEHSARISQHVYDNPDDPVPFEVGARLELDNKRYEVVRIMDERETGLTGYQGAIYQDLSTGELIVAHRGTETSLVVPLATDGFADAQMVAARANMQTRFAEALTREAERMAKNPDLWPKGVTSEPSISHTGHSLGGYHAQQQAWLHGHGGCSFNAFGAAGIGNAPAGIVDGAPAFTSYVRATDVVPAASRQYGNVVSFATEADVAMATRPGARPGVEGPMSFVRNVADDLGGRHSISSFVEGGLMTEANRHRALDHQPQFAEHQRAVHTGREWATYAGDVAQPGAVAATVHLVTAGPRVVTTPQAALAQAGVVGVQAVAAAMQRTPMPEAFEPAQRTPGDAIRHTLEARAGFKDVGAEVTEGSARLTAQLNDVVETTGRGVQQTIGAVRGHAADAVDAVSELGASAHRRLGEVNQQVANAQANMFDAIGLDGMAERLRGRGLDARTEAENRALEVERGAASAQEGLATGRRWAGDAVQGLTDGVSKPIESLTAHHQANAAEARAEAQGMRVGAATVPELLYGRAAPNLDMRASAREKVGALYEQFDRPITPEQLEKLSAAVVAGARETGMNRIEVVRFSQGANSGPDFNGSLIAYDREPLHILRKFSSTPIDTGMSTPVEQSVERTRAANEQQEQRQNDIQQMQARDQAMQESAGMSMRIGARTMDGPGESASAGGDGGGA